MEKRTVKLRTQYYQQFDANPSDEVPAEGFGGWKEAELPLALGHTALVVMHAWDYGAPQDYPGWRRVVEYIPRAEAICRDVFPVLLPAVRHSPMSLFHVVASAGDCEDYLGYRRAKALTGAEPEPPEQVATDSVWRSLQAFRDRNVYVGEHNEDDVRRAFAGLDFAPEARPVGDEGIAANSRQLCALCRESKVNHLVYVGFAINWCLLLSPGGMAEMRQHGLLCSTIPQAVTAVENKETARRERGKADGLWRTALEFGFVYDLEDLLRALSAGRAQ